MGDMNDTIKMIEGHSAELDSKKEKLKEVVLESLGSNVERMRWMLNSTVENIVMMPMATMVMGNHEMGNEDTNPKE
ncbi:hypothetical protein J1N35_004483 [Gossypium stocksii]|uniref:Uncharacterized protein n=1 Tax=Gossypium stocksii TaxID=47602 RepID=A0A9D4AI24_9ROSI|nr:hypothetical protein J1N35_004483 [Gossypium stocksii]